MRANISQSDPKSERSGGKIIDPFAVVALSPRTFQMRKREDALDNAKRICRFMDAAIMVGAWEGFPARLVVIPEMAIQGMIANTPEIERKNGSSR